MENNIIEWAKKFAAAGFYVFPLYNSSKGLMKPFGWARNSNPRLNGKPVDPLKIIPATNDVSEIDGWIDRVKNGYNTSIGAYGVMGINCFIFDLDVKNEKNGVADFNTLKEKLKIPKPELVIKTKSGGYHLYYKRSDKLKNVEVKTLAGFTIHGVKYPGIDVRGNGGMVIGPTDSVAEENWTSGVYQIVKGSPDCELSQIPDEIINSLGRTVFVSNDLENMVDAGEGKSEEDVIATLRRGEIPKRLPNGQRNEGFYAFINGLKSKGIPKESAKILCEQLVKVCDDPETVHQSVNIVDMLDRVYSVNFDNPHDVARDLLAHGFTQLMSEQKSKLMYVVLNENPYLRTTATHDYNSMSTLLARFSKAVVQPNGKPKVVNPMEILVKTITDEYRADILGFKPGAEEIFQITSDEKSKRVLNLYNRPKACTQPQHDTIFDEFQFVVSRIFGDVGSREFQLGMDFAAWVLQRPHLKPAICPYIMSRNRGVGKSLYISAMSHIAGVNKQGEKQCRIVKLDEIGGRFFNPSGFNLLMFDEVQFPVHRDMRKESTTFWRHMKDLVTSTTSTIEIKGGGVFQVPNLAGTLLAGNTGAHFPIEEYDRRIWIIDNNPNELAKGLVDNLFHVTRETVSIDKHRKMVETLRYWLLKHKIELQLDVMRAPMTAVKQDMYRDSLSDIEEWWMSHFEDDENLISKTPIVSKSAVVYLITTSDRLMNTKYREDPEATFRDLKRRGLLQPIRVRGDQAQTRNMTGVPIVTLNGDVIGNDKREVLYTTRNHGEYDGEPNSVLVAMYQENIEKIKNWKSNAIRVKKETSAQDLIH